MPRRSREDEPGAVHHIFNRGLGKRTVFESRDDVRYFLSRLARECRRGRLLVQSYVVRLNHYHLLVSSPLGEVSEAMRVIQNEYVRWFNRLRKRDGPLFRGRFGSKRVNSEAYWWTLLRYIDLHSVKPVPVKGMSIYPYGSAYHFLTESGPIWLSRGQVESALLLASGQRQFNPALYESFLARPLSHAERELVRMRMKGGHQGPDPLDELVKSGPTRIRALMEKRAENADGTRPGIAIASPTHLVEVVAGERSLDPNWYVMSGRQSRDAWELLLTGLLRDACGLSFSDIAARLEFTKSCAQTRVSAHRRLIAEAGTYSDRVVEILARCLEPFQARELNTFCPDTVRRSC